MKKLFLLLMAVFTLAVASAQTRTVTGSVVDADTDEPLIGVSVTAGAGTGATTDVDGNYSIKVPAGAKELHFSYVGYTAVTAPIKSAVVNIRLHAEATALGDVIVTGFGTQTRSSYVGAASVVKADVIEQSQQSNAINALNGRVAGVQLTNASGAPGATTPTLRIRGITTTSGASGANNPLIIMDGAPFAGDMNTINPLDIESMTVLKDAASSALYGARGANGVIVITTKKGSSGGNAVVTLDAKWGANSRGSQRYNTINNPAQYYETFYSALYANAVNVRGMDPETAYRWTNDTMLNDFQNGLGYNVYNIPNGQTLIGRDGKLNPNATMGNIVSYGDQGYLLTADDWIKEAYKTSLRQEYNFSVSNGNEKGNFYASVGYLNNEGITANSSFERLTARLAADTQAKSWLKIGGNASYSHYTVKSLDEDGESSSSGNVFAVATSMAPIYPLYIRDANGNIRIDKYGNTMYDYGDGDNAGLRRPCYGGSNPISQAILDTNKSEGNAFNGVGYAEITFLKDFKFNTTNTVNLDETRGTSVTNPYYGLYAGQNGIVYKTHVRTLDYSFKQMLTWAHMFGLHNVNILAAHENSWQKTFVLSASKYNMFSPTNDELNGAILDNNGAASYTSDYNNEGWVFRGLYDYDNKYFANLGFRRDGSSNFHPDHRWGNFFSFGVAWMINKEEFFTARCFDMFKFKLSFGQTGNDRIGAYRYTNTYSIINNNGEPAAAPSSMGNPLITWEKNSNFNAGFDFAMFNNRLTGSIDGFFRKTTDMLTQFSLPTSFGFSGYYDNIGDMINGGIELDLNGTVIETKDFSWDLNLNLTAYRNKITRIADKNKTKWLDNHQGYVSGSYLYMEGLPMYSFYMPKFAGVNDEGLPTWYIQDRNDRGEKEGEPRVTTNYADASDYDCGTALPDVYGGFGTTLRYKGFDLSVDFAYSIGGQVYDGDYAGLLSAPQSGSTGHAFHADVLKSWTTENPSATIPRWQFGDQYNSRQSDLFLTNASYLNFTNAQFGYTLPQNLTRKIQVNKVRFYFSADNIWIWSKRQGLNPTQSITGSVNNTYYAPMRTLSGGINVSF